MKKILLFSALLLLFTTMLFAQNKKPFSAKSSLEEVFDKPPKSAKPYVFWYWISNNISKEGIKKDLAAMARMGIGGVLIGQIGYKDSPLGDVTMFSEAWWNCLTFALEEASRLGIDVKLFNSPGWSGTGGPWVKPEQAMRYLNVHEYLVRGAQKFQMKLPRYESKELVRQSSLSFEYVIDKSKFKFQQVGVWAFPVAKAGGKIVSFKKDKISSTPQVQGLEAMFDNDEHTKASLYDLPLTIEIKTKENFTARSFEIIPADIALNVVCELEYLNDKGSWQKVLTREVNRSETRIIASGFLPFAPVAESFPEVSSDRFRLTLRENGAQKIEAGSGTSKKEEKGRIAEIKLWSAPRISNYAEKQLGNKAPFEQKDVAFDAQVQAAYAIKKDAGLDLSPYVDANGLLTWNVPPGEWTIQHSGMFPTGVKIHPIPQGTENGFAADVLNKAAIQSSFDSYIGQILKRIPAEKRKTLTGIFIDSYEQGSANWTDGFAKKFKAAYGYDPMRWIPVLSGYVVESQDQSERFLWDVRRLIADLIPDNFEGALLEKSRENGLNLWHEAYGGHGFPGEFFNFGKNNDVPVAEFWYADKPTGSDFSHCRAAASVANIYGRNLVSAEAFTSAQSYLYKLTPRDYKALGDWAFAQGINHFSFHVSIHQPDNKKPGINTWYGSEFNRNNNWFEESKTYIDYIKRCSALLQKGKRETDIAVYIGDDVPYDVPTLPYPVPAGYDLDFVNYEVLLKLARVENGRLVFPSGATYKVLVLPPNRTMRPELLDKLEAFVKAGLTIYGPRPDKSPSLKGFPGCDNHLNVMAGRLWGKIDGKTILWNNYGKGKVYFGVSLEKFFTEIGLTPDLKFPNDFVYSHRKETDNDIYFIANQKNEERKAEVSFRVTGKQPEYWNPLTGERKILENYFMKDGRTVIPLEFPQSGSCFIIFKNKGGNSGKNGANFPTYQHVQSIDGDWNVKFAGNINLPFNRTFSQLSDWTLSDDKAVKYFCGKATYSISFPFNGKLPGTWYLNLGQVESLVKVKLNGKEINTLWCYPYRVDVSGYLVKGNNKLEIELVNQWWNRLIGDEQPGEARSTTVSARLFWKASDQLVPAGLLGPVNLERAR